MGSGIVSNEAIDYFLPLIVLETSSSHFDKIMNLFKFITSCNWFLFLVGIGQVLRDKIICMEIEKKNENKKRKGRGIIASKQIFSFILYFIQSLFDDCSLQFSTIILKRMRMYLNNFDECFLKIYS